MLLPNKRLYYILTELKLVSDLQKPGQAGFSLERLQQESCDTRIDRD